MNPALTAPEPSDVHGKALSLNLEGSIYGTLAEIGAGQEVARWFLSVGAASGTVAKTMSAYDKTFSDEIYGAGTRYVSKERLVAMLNWEYRLLLERLSASRGTAKRFFVFADTAAARNFEGTNQQHGWLGIRFQTEPGSKPSQILLHINLFDSTAQRQQHAVGILGVNLIYAAFHQRGEIGTFMDGLFEELTTARIEIDVIEVDGPAFLHQDTNEWCLALLYRKMAHAVLFDEKGGPVEPASVLRKRPLLVMRGTSDHPELLDPELLEAASRRLRAEGVKFERDPVTLTEMSTCHVDCGRTPPAVDMLKCVRQLSPRGPLILSDLAETYLLSRYLRRYSTEPVRFVLSIAAAAKIMHETFYQNLPGTLLEGLGKLLAANVKLYVAPMPRQAVVDALRDLSGGLPLRPSGKGLVGLDDLKLSGPSHHLFEYLRESGRLLELTEPDVRENVPAAA
ncbi:MAG TPA: hypothetical protein VKB88_18860 [Bryobacteraceae bacterium]|nr:hypothetical protein [Bryobacteraceae bacterium]